MKLFVLFFLATLVLGCATTKPHSDMLPKGEIASDRSIDLRGKTITPFIVFYIVKNLSDMQKGEVLEVSTDNFEAIENDIGAWSRMTGFPLEGIESGDTYQRYYIRNIDNRNVDKKTAMIISDPGLEMLLSPLGLALSAALSGQEVYLYFQGPAVKVLKKGFNARLRGMQRPFSSLARNQMAKAGHLPPQEKLQQLKELGAHFYICGGSMEPFNVKKRDLIFDDIVIAEYLTFLEIMNDADNQVFLQ